MWKELSDDNIMKRRQGMGLSTRGLGYEAIKQRREWKYSHIDTISHS